MRYKGLSPGAILFDKPLEKPRGMTVDNCNTLVTAMILASIPGRTSHQRPVKEATMIYDFTKFPPPGLGFTKKAPTKPPLSQEGGSGALHC